MNFVFARGACLVLLAATPGLLGAVDTKLASGMARLQALSECLSARYSGKRKVTELTPVPSITTNNNRPTTRTQTDEVRGKVILNGKKQYTETAVDSLPTFIDIYDG